MTPEQLSAAIVDVLATLSDEGVLTLPDGVPSAVTVERPRVREHGDYATNVALQLGKKAGMNPRETEAVVASIRRAHEELAVAVLVVEHDMRLIMNLCRHIQVLDRVQSTDVPTLQKTSSVSVIKTPTIGYQGLTLNIGNKNGLLKPYSNVGTPLAKSQFLRTAFDLALDRTAINRVVFNGLHLPDCYPISPVSPWYVTTKGLECNLKGDIATAQKLVKASGVQPPIKVTLPGITPPPMTRSNSPTPVR